MKKYLLLLFHFALCPEFFGMHCAFSQTPGEWVWLRGDSTPLGTGYTGVQGVPGPLNDPQSTYESCSWTDLNSKFWIYGGWGPSGTFADMWMYDPLSNEWTWMKGPGISGYSGNFGIQGVSSPLNNPPALSQGISTWTDPNGDLWMFGGNTNNLWRFNIAANEWTWMKGSNISLDDGVYGTQGIPDPLNNPASRYETATTWTDTSGHLWLFGGLGWINNSFGSLNDLWKYNISTNEWAWMKGSSALNQMNTYGTLGIEDPANTPGARACYTHWVDGNNMLWLFGGERAFSPIQQYNDLWRYNPVSGMWTWMAGTNISHDNGNYGTKCLALPSYVPGSRFENRTVWSDANQNFWLFGGGSGASAGSVYNDLWMYCVQSGMWIWQSGSDVFNPPGHWGVLGVSDPLNVPNGRVGAVSWGDGNNHLYFFGGSSSSWSVYHNDLWMYTIDTSCTACITVPVANFSAPDICPGTCADFINLSSNAVSYLWSFPGGIPTVSTDFNPTGICYSTPGTYDVTLIATNSNGSDTLTLQNYITVYPYPPPQGILQSGDTLFANAGATSYQWYFNGGIINGATDYYYIATTGGNYNVVATDTNGCEVEAVINDVLAGLTATLSKGEGVVFPNPVLETLSIIGYPPALLTNGSAGLSGKAVELSIYNIMGEKIIDASPLSLGEGPGGEAMWTIDCRPLPTGMYFIEIHLNNKTFRTKFLKSTYR